MKRNKIIYWIATIWLSLGMSASAVAQLLRIPEGVEAMAKLGYPKYLMTILGVWKILGAIAILAPRYPLVKEWAYAGFFFVTSGALISHVVMRESIGDTFPSILLLTLTVVSWYFRPESRRFD